MRWLLFLFFFTVAVSAQADTAQETSTPVTADASAELSYVENLIQDPADESPPPTCEEQEGEVDCSLYTGAQIVSASKGVASNPKPRKGDCDWTVSFELTASCRLFFSSTVIRSCPEECGEGDGGRACALGLAEMPDQRYINFLIGLSNPSFRQKIYINSPYRVAGDCGSPPAIPNAFIEGYLQTNHQMLLGVFKQNYCDGWFANIPEGPAGWKWTGSLECHERDLLLDNQEL